MNKGNQQATLTEAEIAWLAAIIEGEGSLSLSLWKRDESSGRKPKIGLKVNIYNTDAGIILKAVEIIEKLGARFHVREREQAPMAKRGGGIYAGNGSMITVTVGHLESVYHLVRRLRPWFFGDKAPRADLIIRYLEQRFAKIEANGGNWRGTPYDEGDFAIVSEFYGLTNPNKARMHPAVKRVLNEYEQGASATA